VKFKTVRGMQDFLPERAAKKQWIEEKCRRVFERYGFAPMETPIVEDSGLLAKKGSSGEEIKEEIYCFKDKSERELGLRFDLTVPLARVVAANPQLARPFKRYAVGRVYRYDRPGEKRWREFTQADWDILGVGSIAADLEVIMVAVDIMKKLGFKKGEFTVKINSRRLLEEIALESGVKKGQMQECFRSIDKLEKIGRRGVERELEEKKISTQILGQIGVGVKKPRLKNPAPLTELQGLLRLLKSNGLGGFVDMDLCLARGLDYYTGMVFEVKLGKGPSVGGGGRYDKLIEAYGGKPTPAVGGSLGVERLLAALEDRIKIKPATSVFLIPIGENAFEECLKTATRIRELQIGCEIDLMNRGIGKNIRYADKKGIPFAAIMGDKELKEKALALKNLKTGKQEKVKLADLTKLKEVAEKE
jgi:histidyl-tRNA synthetase